MRLDKFLASATGMSRADCKKALHRGDVVVGGVEAKKGVMQVGNEEVWYQGKLLSIRPTLYLMLNKPTGFECSTQPTHHPSALSLIPNELQGNLHFAGRLDSDATGLLLITEDGDWSHRISAPAKAKEKTYVVELSEPLADAMVALFAEGLLLHGEAKPTRPALLEILSTHRARITITEGRYHQIKRMFAAAGTHVTALHRETIGTIALDQALAPGQWRHLTAKEVQSV